VRRNRSSATIADVASHAGVGAGTVSRVLNGRRVSGQARARVLAAIDELGCFPPAGARSMVTGSTGTLAVVIPFFTHPSAVERMRGILAAVDATAYELVVCNVATPGQRDEYLARRAPLDRSDGLLVVSLAPRDAEVEAFRRAGAPVVLLDTFHPEAGLPVEHELQRAGPHGRTVAQRLTRELLSLPVPPTAIRAASDTQALGVLEAAEYEGFSVPGDRSVVGFDDLADAPYVGLTTVRQPLEESGRRGIERLVAALDGDAEVEPHEERLELELVVRRTTAPPR
jgi:DNA-binding LacI/PurR family transcriptional regulator